MAIRPTFAAVFTAVAVTYSTISCCSGMPHSTPAELEQLADANTHFAFNLYHKIREMQNSENIFFSPWSISQALAMVYAGASANTKDQMAEVLKFKDVEDIHRKFRDLMDSIFEQPPDGYTMKQANKLYESDKIAIEEDFLSVLRDVYQSPLEKKDFSSMPEESRQEINKWVEEQTESKIKELLPKGSIDSGTLMVLINTLYFKAKWENAFPPEGVTDGNFYVKQIPGGEDEFITVPMMVNKKARVKYLHNTEAKYQMVDLPYAGNNVSLIIMLPDERFGIDNMRDHFTMDSIKEVQSMWKDKVEIHLPKFKLRAKFKLKATLSQLGMPDAFSDKADFSEMTQDPVMINEVYHQGFIDVNEEGTEAAASTAVEFIPRMGFITEPVRFIVDHPFLLIIKENGTGTILFMGMISNPQTSESS